MSSDHGCAPDECACEELAAELEMAEIDQHLREEWIVQSAVARFNAQGRSDIDADDRLEGRGDNHA